MIADTVWETRESEGHDEALTKEEGERGTMLSGRESEAVQYYIRLGKTRPIHCQRAPGGQGGRVLSFLYHNSGWIGKASI